MNRKILYLIPLLSLGYASDQPNDQQNSLKNSEEEYLEFSEEELSEERENSEKLDIETINEFILRIKSLDFKNSKNMEDEKANLDVLNDIIDEFLNLIQRQSGVYLPNFLENSEEEYLEFSEERKNSAKLDIETINEFILRIKSLDFKNSKNMEDVQGNLDILTDIIYEFLNLIQRQSELGPQKTEYSV
jgi:hypothetical protein